MAVLKSPKNNHGKAYWRHCKAGSSKRAYLTSCISSIRTHNICELGTKVTWRSFNYAKNRSKLKAKLKLSYFY